MVALGSAKDGGVYIFYPHFSTCYTIFEIFHSDPAEKPEKLTQKAASVPIRFMEKGFNAAYTPQF